MALTAWLARRRVALGFACGVAALWLAHPTWRSWMLGCGVAVCGEALRIWAAGHLEKNREVTASGPYRFVAHPLYLGSAIMGVGVALAASSLVVAAVAGLYMAVTFFAAARREAAFLSATFGEGYDAYQAGRTLARSRTFSLARARRNGEHRTVAGLVGVAVVLAVKVLRG